MNRVLHFIAACRQCTCVVFLASVFTGCGQISREEAPSVSERSLQGANVTETIREARFTFRVRKSALVELYTEVDFIFSGGVINGGQFPMLSDTGANCLDNAAIQMKVGSTNVNATANAVSDGRLWMANFELPQPLDSTVVNAIVEAKLLYGSQGLVCEIGSGGPRKLFFPWADPDQWTSVPQNYTYRIEFPDESISGFTDFVCFGDPNMLKCGVYNTGLEYGANWVSFTSTSPLTQAFFQWDVPTTKTKRDCATPPQNNRAVPMCATVVDEDDFGETQGKWTVLGAWNTWDEGAKKWLALFCMLFALLAGIIILGGCAHREDDPKSGEERRAERHGESPTRADSGGGVNIGITPASPTEDEFDPFPWRQDSHVTGRTEQTVASDDRQISRCEYYRANAMLFLAYWFGSRSFDVDGDDDFDRLDVRAFIRMSWLEKRRIIGKQFRRRRLPDANYVRERARRQASGESLGGATGAPSSAVGRSRQSDYSFGDVGTEIEIAERIIKKQRWPLFICFHTCIVWLLWFVGAVSDGTSYGGLDSFSKGTFDLILTRPSSEICEDFRFQLWRWLTYQYTHVGFMHVSMNCLTNLVFGIPIEGVHGWKRMTFLYQAGVIAGACCALVNSPQVSVVGMSGGCYALLGMILADLVINWYEKHYRWIQLIVIFVFGVIDWIQFGAFDETVSHATHIGGYLGGTLLGVLIGKNYKVEVWERRLAILIFTCGVILWVFSGFWSLLQFPPKDIWEEVGWCWARQIQTTSSGWLCVRCGDDQACIDKWNTAYAGSIRQVGINTCYEKGFIGP